MKHTFTSLDNICSIQLARRKLDEAVFAAYGWKSNLSDEDVLEKLLTLNLERAGKDGN